MHGTVREVVSERFLREAPHLRPLPAVRYDTSYQEYRVAGWDGYIDVRGNRYSVPGSLSGTMVRVRISLEGTVSVLTMDEQKVVEHRLVPAREGWVTQPGHHEELWQQTLRVQQRELSVYEEVASCSW